jgi:hypothetical protein
MAVRRFLMLLPPQGSRNKEDDHHQPWLNPPHHNSDPNSDLPTVSMFIVLNLVGVVVVAWVVGGLFAFV